MAGLCDPYENALIIFMSCDLSRTSSSVIWDEAFTVSHADSHEIIKSYMSSLSNNSGVLKISQLLFDWVEQHLDLSRDDLVFAFYKTSYERLWITLDASHEVWMQMTAAVAYAQRLITSNA